MRKFLIFSALVIACNAHATPASQESVENLLVATKIESKMELLYDSMEQMMRYGIKQSVDGKQLSPKQQQLLDSLPAKFAAIMREDFNWAKMKPMYVQLYCETFEEEEVQGLVDFYASPTGQAFVNKMPVVMQKSMALSQSMMQSLMPKMTATIKDAMTEARITK